MSGTLGRSSWSACVLIVPILIIIHVHSIEGHLQRRYTEEEICNETRKTFETVKTCPELHSVIIQRSQMKNCSKYPMCHEEQLIYHCFGYNESFVEVCAPINRIVGHFCVLFDYGVGRILPDYNKPCPECPSVYSSNESSTYLSCVAPILSTSTPKTVFDSTSDLAKSINLKKKPTKGHNIRLISNLPERINSAGSTSEPLVTTTRFMIPGNDTIHTREKSSDSAEIYFTVIGLIVILIIIVLGIVFYKYKRKCLDKRYIEMDGESGDEDENEHDQEALNPEETMGGSGEKKPPVQSDGLDKRYIEMDGESGDEGEYEHEQEAMNPGETMGGSGEKKPPVQSDGLDERYIEMGGESGDEGENEHDQEALNPEETMGGSGEKKPPVQSDGLDKRYIEMDGESGGELARKAYELRKSGMKTRIRERKDDVIMEYRPRD